MVRMTRRSQEQGVIFDIQRFSVHDGPGIRTTVFLKGCPLRCLWCHNPESQRMQPDLAFERDLCIQCGACVDACSKRVHAIVEGTRSLHRDQCEGCGDCADACPTNALVLKGQTMTVEEVLREVLRDERLYRKSGGGVTLSGGEPVMQPAFTYGILQNAKEHGLHTAIETCGHAPWTTVKRIAAVTDLVIYDLKHLDATQHTKLTGVGNTRILQNLQNLREENHEVLVRLPLIPDLNDSTENLQQTADFLRQLGIDRVEVIPYHEFAATKYELLGHTYRLHDLQTYTAEQVAEKQQTLAARGFKVTIGV